MMEQSGIVVEPKQQRADNRPVLRVAEPADDAVGGALLLDLDHRPLARAVFEIGALGDDSVERAAAALQPTDRHVPVAGHRRQLEAGSPVFSKELYQLPPALVQPPADNSPQLAVVPVARAPAAVNAAGPLREKRTWPSIRKRRPPVTSTASVRPRCRRRTIIPSARSGCCCGGCSSLQSSPG